jgi:hypothetical protein
VEYRSLREFIRGPGWSAVAIIFSNLSRFAGGSNCRRVDVLYSEKEQNTAAPPKRQIQRGQGGLFFHGKASWRTHQRNFSLYPGRNASNDSLNYLFERLILAVVHGYATGFTEKDQHKGSKAQGTAMRGGVLFPGSFFEPLIL